MTAVKERPILFSGAMVKALLAGRKTQTRRVIKSPKWWKGMTYYATGNVDATGRTRTNMVLCEKTAEHWQYCPYGVPGDRLWVRETWMEFERTPSIETTIGGGSRVVGRLPGGIGYRADLDSCGQVPVTEDGLTVLRTPKGPWKPSIFLPREASRITLEITEVRVERLRSICVADAIAEGIEAFTYAIPPNPPGQTITAYNTENWYPTSEPTAPGAYAQLWDSINDETCSWKSNPWVWVLAFRRLETT